MASVWHWVNQHSYLLVFLVLGALTFAVVRRRSTPTRVVALVALIAIFAAAAVWLRTGAGDTQATSHFDRVVGHGQPVALEFYSNF